VSTINPFVLTGNATTDHRLGWRDNCRHGNQLKNPVNDVIWTREQEHNQQRRGQLRESLYENFYVIKYA